MKHCTCIEGDDNAPDHSPGCNLLSDWRSTKTDAPADGLLVETKIHDHQGCRNEVTLRRQGRLWFTPGDNAMYVYYTPTHWRPLPATQSLKDSP